MNSEVDLTKQCYQIWHKVAKVAKKVPPEMAKSCQSGEKEFRRFQGNVPTTQAMATLPVFKKVSSIALL